MLRNAATAQVILVGIGADRGIGDVPGDQRTLVRSHHPDGDVRFAPQQIADRIGRHDLDRDSRLLSPQPGENGRQQVPGHRLDGGDADRARQLFALAGQHAADGIGVVRHGAGVIGDRERDLGRHEAASRALEQHHAELALEFRDMPPEGGLAAAEMASGGEQTSPFENRQKRAHQRPVEGRTRLRAIHYRDHGMSLHAIVEHGAALHNGGSCNVNRSSPCIRILSSMPLRLS